MAIVLRNALWLVVAGLVVGTPAALWSKRIAASMLENLSSGGARPIAVAIVGMITVALVAAYVPARRATQVEPLTALRSD
jgi:ABC-type antimicrobial peptide transport system permease subunit